MALLPNPTRCRDETGHQDGKSDERRLALLGVRGGELSRMYQPGTARTVPESHPTPSVISPDLHMRAEKCGDWIRARRPNLTRVARRVRPLGRECV